jgi:hypothetical protein
MVASGAEAGMRDAASSIRPLSWQRLTREASRLARVFDARTEDSHDIIDAATLLPQMVDMLDAYYLPPETAHEASQGAYMQAAWLEERANNEPHTGKRNELMRRAYAALAAGNKLRGLAGNVPRSSEPSA